MPVKIPLEYGNYYHIFNRGNNYENLYKEDKDYLHFIKLYLIYIHGIANTLTWCLIGNHFHFLVQIKEEKEIGYLNPETAKSYDLENKWRLIYEPILNAKMKRPDPTQQFKHLFNSYAKWFNQKYGRRGTLFEKSYERKLVEDEKYLKDLIIYIHNNPVHHNFTDNAQEYKWSSYHSFLGARMVIPIMENALELFDSKDNFVKVHLQKAEFEKLEKLIIE